MVSHSVAIIAVDEGRHCLRLYRGRSLTVVTWKDPSLEVISNLIKSENMLWTLIHITCRNTGEETYESNPHNRFCFHLPPKKISKLLTSFHPAFYSSYTNTADSPRDLGICKLCCTREKKLSKTFNIFDKRELKRKSKIPNVALHIKKKYFHLHKKITTTKKNILSPNFLAINLSKLRW